MSRQEHFLAAIVAVPVVIAMIGTIVAGQGILGPVPPQTYLTFVGGGAALLLCSVGVLTWVWQNHVRYWFAAGLMGACVLVVVGGYVIAGLISSAV